MKSILNPDQSVLVGLASGGVIMAIYQGALPAFAQIRASDAQDRDIEGSRKLAAWASAGLLGFMFLLTRDKNAFLIGGLALAGVDLLVKHSNGMNPLTGILDIFDGHEGEPLDMEMATSHPLPDYSDTNAVSEMADY